MTRVAFLMAHTSPLDPPGWGWLALEFVSRAELEFALVEIYEMVEITFRPLLRAGFVSREKNS